MTPQELLEKSRLTTIEQAQLDTYLDSDAGATHAHFHQLLENDLTMPRSAPTQADLLTLARGVQQRVRRRTVQRRRLQFAGGLAVALLVAVLAFVQLIPPSEPSMAETSPVYAVDVWDLEPQLVHAQLAIFDQPLEGVQAQIDLPLIVPQQLPVGFEFVGAIYNERMVSADIALAERADARAWILSQRKLDDPSLLLTTALGPIAGVTRYEQPLLTLFGAEAILNNYTYGSQDQHKFQTVDWATATHQLRMTVYGDEWVSAEEIIGTVTHLNLSQ